MAVNGTHDTGEEWKQKTLYRQDLIARDASIDVGLYNDGTDALTESSDIGAITTEPTSGNYARQTISLDSADFSLSLDGSNNVVVTGTVTFDTTDTTELVDGMFSTVVFQSTVVNSESSENEHLLTSGTFGDTDLSQYSSVDVTFSDTLD